jgi:sigma-B regulation protein RsbU (phosphoserine phosphatase)
MNAPVPTTLTLQSDDGGALRKIVLRRLPFVIGRGQTCDLVLPFPYTSRIHAQLLEEGSDVVVEDCGSRHGTFVNGQRIVRHTLASGDAMQFGSLDAPRLRLEPRAVESAPGDSAAQTTNVTQTQLRGVRPGRSDLEKLLWFLEAAQSLNSSGQVDRVFASLLETTLSLAGMDRGFVFLQSRNGEAGSSSQLLDLAFGLDARGTVLDDASTISHSVLNRAAQGTDQYVLTDNLNEANVAESILAHNLRTILCIPLRQTRESRTPGTGAPHHPVIGVLYLDSSFHPELVSEVDQELLRTIAREAAALVENAQLAVLEDQARLHKEELQIAAHIQQRLMAVDIPSLPFAEIQAKSIACHEVGGDFYDVISAPECLAVALVDVSGKGVSAAILASTLQGMLFTQLSTGQPLASIAAATNRYLCLKNVGKYATMLLARLYPTGHLEYLNCGHIRPRVCVGGEVLRLPVLNLPVGLMAQADYEAGSVMLNRGDCLVMVSDGFTEAEDHAGEFFGEDRFDQAIRCSEIQKALTQMTEFCGGYPATDDITIVQLRFTAPAG